MLKSRHRKYTIIPIMIGRLLQFLNSNTKENKEKKMVDY